MSFLLPAFDLFCNAVEDDPCANKTKPHEEEEPETGPITRVCKIETGLGDQDLGSSHRGWLC